MSNASLRLTYTPDDQYFGEVIAVVVSGAFSGRGRGWFDKDQIKTTFLAALRVSPIPAAPAPKIESGYANKEQRDILDLCFLRIEIVPYDGRGTPLVKVDLMTEPRDTQLAVERGNLQKVEARFLTEYAALDRFAVEFGEVLDGMRQEVNLIGEALV
jgi:hypothetical protein